MPRDVNQEAENQLAHLDTIVKERHELIENDKKIHLQKLKLNQEYY